MPTLQIGGAFHAITNRPHVLTNFSTKVEIHRIQKMSRKLKVVALVSGGKDSCYSMLQCVAAGHEIVALANLRPHDQSSKFSKKSSN